MVPCGRELHGDECIARGRCYQHEGCYQRSLIQNGGVAPAPHQCVMTMSTGRWCTRDRRPGTMLCERHHARVLAASYQNRLRELRALSRQLRAARVPWDIAVERIGAVTNVREEDRDTEAWRYFQRVVPFANNEGPLGIFENFVTWALLPLARRAITPRPPTALPQPPPVPQARQELARIATDKQNVHTKAVSDQTNKIQEKLFELGGDTRVATNFIQLVAFWASKNWVKDLKQMSDLTADMDRFYNMGFIRQSNDFLYRRLFNAVFTTITKQKKEECDEMYKRLCEECIESIGMCTEGHITRLCNVFVGFHDAFQPQVSIGELLQQKIAAISGLDVPTDEKIRQAKQVFTELAVPDNEQTSWIEALAE